MKTHWVVCLYVEDLTPARSTLLSCSTAPRQVDEVLVPSGALQFPDHSKPNQTTTTTKCRQLIGMLIHTSHPGGSRLPVTRGRVHRHKHMQQCSNQNQHRLRIPIQHGRCATRYATKLGKRMCNEFSSKLCYKLGVRQWLHVYQDRPAKEQNQAQACPTALDSPSTWLYNQTRHQKEQDALTWPQASAV